MGKLRRRCYLYCLGCLEAVARSRSLWYEAFAFPGLEPGGFSGNINRLKVPLFSFPKTLFKFT